MALTYTPVKFGSYNEGEVEAHSDYWKGMSIAVCKPNP
jgi:hypothetical protein